MYHRLIALLDDHAVDYELIEHPPEGRTEIVSELRHHPVAEAAKCIVLMAKLGRKSVKYILGVVPGDKRVDFDAVKHLLGATYVTFASAEKAGQLAGSVPGTILPFSFNPDLELFVDPLLLEHERMYFNAARLDRSISLSARDYLDVSKARMARITMQS